MHYENITTRDELRDFCGQLAGVETIAFDTEFVSEHSYKPDLCLIQVAADDRLAVIDPHAIGDVVPFWEVVAGGSHETIVHAGREEFLFCRRAIGRRPTRLFDVQLAAGLAGLEYPAAYHKLIEKLLGKSLPKLETRTDWRRRPLSERQIRYALQDVLYLKQVRDVLFRRLERRGRADWIEDEMRAWQDDVERVESHERWRRVSGVVGLSRRSLAVAQRLWQWRETEAERRNCPVRRVLRDDLIIVLSKTASSSVKRIRAIRGMERGDLSRRLGELAACVQEAIELPEDELPAIKARKPSSQVTVLGQFIATALATVCREQQLAHGLVGTVQDIRDLVAFRLLPAGQRPDELPALARGWRAEVVGKLIDNMLEGKLAVRIGDPRSDTPLVIEPAAE